MDNSFMKMVKMALIKFVVLMLCISTVYGQKVKYKDIWGLLNTKQFETAEPFLKRYLKENDDNPNAFLYMGIIYHEKSNKDDVLKQTKRVLANIDSAILFYDKAYKTVTEKEVKRNDEYYQSYNRRDLRTGEFGVKLSDIQYDLEKKMEGLRERVDRIKMVKHYFMLSDSLYKKSNAFFKSIQSAFPGEKEFYLRSDQNTVKQLTVLSMRFDSCAKAFEQYKASIATLGKIGYSQTLTLNEIRDFKKDGLSGADFYQNDLQVWDYKKFADQAKLAIEKEIMPMRENLISYDVEVNKLRERLNKDSISVRNDLTKLIDKLLLDQLKKYDATPLPMEIFSLKIADLEYRSALLEHKPLRDSADVHLQLKLANQEVKYVTRLDSIAGKLMSDDFEKEAENYAYFITNTYSNTMVLKSFIKVIKEYAERERKIRNEQLAKRKESLRWIIDGQDSIPLFMENNTSMFKPLAVTEEKYTVGLHYTDSLTANGYFYSITASRKPEIKISFPVDKASFKQSRLSVARTLTFSDPGGQIYFVLVYSTRVNKENKYSATLAKIYRSDGLAWSNNYMLGFVPNEISFKPDTGELTIKADALLSVVDKNGKMLK